ncbi:S41 family peptidase [Anaerotignum propionicum]|uniref:Carboxy-terminal processing protease CtpB n=1 Tax=Anaerotignum propionicum DSM 1682 TaxID=991789 RepID=A0A0X8VAR7_ANAPI|nr:S41 family peptidase [Anaerotignum propionicum]AMJ42167.1 carboxy-terminal processing protease CtpB precursor [Anaerotignum propionicum DSM 1682]SHE52936.1 carboxyl-terminal processing protease [[Clostridium] propionicum DSM 1682] [Anaerotignum propionicum DSM 1682]
MKKDFWKGFGAAVAVMLVCSMVGRTALVQQWVPWQYLPFDIGMSKAAKMDVIEDFLDRYYVDDLDKDMLDEGMFAGMVAGVGDRYTYYMTKDYLEKYLQNTGGHFEGIGVTVYQSEDGGVVVYSLMEGYPAQKAGVLAGDIIKKIDGEDVTSLTLNDVAEKMRGPVGSTVKIDVFRPSNGATQTFTLKREDVIMKSVESRMLDKEKGYICISGFKENTYDQFMAALKELQGQGMKGLVLDLRNNPGGLVRSVYLIGDELLPKGLMVYTEDKEGKREELICDDKYLDIPMVVLVNGNSASASEIFAGAAKDMGAATLVGTQTFGKGLVQRLFTLPDGSGLNITIQKYFTPNGTSIHGTGITPDKVVELPEGYEDAKEIPVAEDTQLKEGISVLDEKI